MLPGMDVIATGSWSECYRSQTALPKKETISLPIQRKAVLLQADYYLGLDKRLIHSDLATPLSGES